MPKTVVSKFGLLLSEKLLGSQPKIIAFTFFLLKQNGLGGGYFSWFNKID